MVVGPDGHWEKIKSDPSLIPQKKKKKKGRRNIAQGENTGEFLYDWGTKKGFFPLTQNPDTIKERTYISEYIRRCFNAYTARKK